jgi:hypothetical protein
MRGTEHKLTTSSPVGVASSGPKIVSPALATPAKTGAADAGAKYVDCSR